MWNGHTIHSRRQGLGSVAPVQAIVRLFLPLSQARESQNVRNSARRLDRSICCFRDCRRSPHQRYSTTIFVEITTVAVAAVDGVKTSKNVGLGPGARTAEGSNQDTNRFEMHTEQVNEAFSVPSRLR